MATAHMNFSSSPSLFQCKTPTTTTTTTTTTKFFSSVSVLPPSVSFPTFCCPSITLDASPAKARVFRVFAVAEEAPVSAVAESESPPSPPPPPRDALVKPFQLYVCNLPSSYDTPQLQDLFTPYGSIESAEISRNADTGLSKGVGYVTMGSISEAIAAVVALDESDVGGRQLRVKFSQDMNKKKNVEILNSLTNKSVIFETPHKLYVGNLVWAIKPDLLRQHFTQFGTVVSVRVLYDRKTGKNRVYAFLSFSSAEELQAAVSADGTELLGRKMVVRNALRSAASASQ